MGPRSNRRTAGLGDFADVGNDTTQDVSILKIDGGEVTDTGKRLALPGPPASMRGRAR
jgi:hypothetical protein